MLFAVIQPAFNLRQIIQYINNENTDHVYLNLITLVLRSKFYGTWTAWQNKSSTVKWMDSISFFAF